MKTKSFLLILVICSISYSINAQIKLTTDNKIGIGTATPSAKVEIYSETTKFSRVNNGYSPIPTIVDWQYQHPRIYPNTNHTGYLGTPNAWNIGTFDYVQYYVSCTKLSDAKFKKNIAPLSKSLDRIIQLNGVKYDLDFNIIGINTQDKDEHFGGKQMGLVAQDVMRILPEIVKSDSIGLGIDYIQLIPLLIEAIKEQQKEIETLQTLATIHEEELITITKKLESLEGSSKLKGTSLLETNAPKNGSAVLFQNIPNPFTIDTKIEYFVPEETIKASIIIHDIQGNEVKQTEIEYKGSGNIIIPGATLHAGLYLYSLIADGQIIDIKRMILTK